MTVTMSTYKGTLNTSSKDTLSSRNDKYSDLFFSQIKSKIKDVIVVYSYYNDVELDLSNKDLTETTKKLAITSFSKEWDKEDDNYWNNY
jgi:hypothetical protein